MAAGNGFGSSSTAEDVTDGADLSSKVVIVTGGNAGIGYETARVLAKRGAHVILGCRNLEAAETAKASITEKVPNAQLTVIGLDLSSLVSVREFSNAFKALNLPLNILINNAGLASNEFKLSKDQIELTFATNHLGHFHLTQLLLDIMVKTANDSGIEGRIVIVASRQHVSAKGLDFENLQTPNWQYSIPLIKSIYGLQFVYAQSKLANVLHAKELHRRLKDRNASVTVNALHPGVIRTNIVGNFFKPAALFYSAFPSLFKTIEQGAATTCYVATHPDVTGVTGKYFIDCNEAEVSKQANDEKLAKELWIFSEELTKDY